MKINIGDKVRIKTYKELELIGFKTDSCLENELYFKDVGLWYLDQMEKHSGKIFEVLTTEEFKGKTTYLLSGFGYRFAEQIIEKVEDEDEDEDVRLNTSNVFKPSEQSPSRSYIEESAKYLIEELQNNTSVLPIPDSKEEFYKDILDYTMRELNTWLYADKNETAEELIGKLSDNLNSYNVGEFRTGKDEKIKELGSELDKYIKICEDQVNIIDKGIKENDGLRKELEEQSDLTTQVYKDREDFLNEVSKYTGERTTCLDEVLDIIKNSSVNINKQELIIKNSKLERGIIDLNYTINSQADIIADAKDKEKWYENVISKLVDAK